ncbi:glutamate racemase [Candidatus Parcubacteria bacterium]|nr:glutamate racemase [Candidatus Parcubacteria bacterium]
MIGVFDSGLGGLTILKHFLKELPQYNYIYLGDSARAPYGNRSQDVIYGYAKEAVDFLFSKGCVIIIFACNTASSQALRKIQQEYLPKKYPDKKVLGVIIPLVEKSAKNDKIKKIGIIGTKATIASNVYCKELLKINAKLKIFQKSAPLLVPLIEEGWIKKKETKMIFKKYLRELKMEQIDALILACTHYPILIKNIKRIMPKRCIIYNPGEIVAKSFKKYLEKHPKLKTHQSNSPICKFYTTDSINNFKTLGEKFLGQKINEIKKIKL